MATGKTFGRPGLAPQVVRLRSERPARLLRTRAARRLRAVRLPQPAAQHPVHLLGTGQHGPVRDRRARLRGPQEEQPALRAAAQPAVREPICSSKACTAPVAGSHTELIMRSATYGNRSVPRTASAAPGPKGASGSAPTIRPVVRPAPVAVRRRLGPAQRRPRRLPGLGAAGGAPGADQVAQGQAVAVPEGRTGALAVVGEEHDAVRPGRAAAPRGGPRRRGPDLPSARRPPAPGLARPARPRYPAGRAVRRPGRRPGTALGGRGRAPAAEGRAVGRCRAARAPDVGDASRRADDATAQPRQPKRWERPGNREAG